LVARSTINSAISSNGDSPTQQLYNAWIHLRRGTQRVGDLVFLLLRQARLPRSDLRRDGWIYGATHTHARVKRERIWSSDVRYGRVR